MSDLAAPGGADADLVYMRVADDIAARIRSGERELAEHYRYSYGSIRSAMKVLRERGLIVTRHGRGTFVSGKP
jgi:DNA-binding GntR family transcriptional regulator